MSKDSDTNTLDQMNTKLDTLLERTAEPSFIGKTKDKIKDDFYDFGYDTGKEFIFNGLAKIPGVAQIQEGFHKIISWCWIDHSCNKPDPYMEQFNNVMKSLGNRDKKLDGIIGLLQNISNIMTTDFSQAGQAMTYLDEALEANTEINVKSDFNALAATDFSDNGGTPGIALSIVIGPADEHTCVDNQLPESICTAIAKNMSFMSDKIHDLQYNGTVISNGSHYQAEVNPLIREIYFSDLHALVNQQFWNKKWEWGNNLASKTRASEVREENNQVKNLYKQLQLVTGKANTFSQATSYIGSQFEILTALENSKNSYAEVRFDLKQGYIVTSNSTMGEKLKVINDSSTILQQVLNYSATSLFYISSYLRALTYLEYQFGSVYNSASGGNFRENYSKAYYAVNRGFVDDITQKFKFSFYKKTDDDNNDHVTSAYVPLLPQVKNQKFTTWGSVKDDLNDRYVFMKIDFDINDSESLGADKSKEIAENIIMGNYDKLPQSLNAQLSSTQINPSSISITERTIINTALLVINSNKLDKVALTNSNGDKYGEIDVAKYNKLVDSNYKKDNPRLFGNYAGIVYNGKYSNQDKDVETDHYSLVVRFKIGSTEFGSGSYWDAIINPNITQQGLNYKYEPIDIKRFGHLLPSGNWPYYCKLNDVSTSLNGINASQSNRLLRARAIYGTYFQDAGDKISSTEQSSANLSLEQPELLPELKSYNQKFDSHTEINLPNIKYQLDCVTRTIDRPFYALEKQSYNSYDVILSNLCPGVAPNVSEDYLHQMQLNFDPSNQKFSCELPKPAQTLK